MLRSLYSGVSGLRAHQTMMDTVGNDIANVNTVGFKSSQIDFEDTLSQELLSPTGAQNGSGGTNPAQVGLGVKLAAITTNFSQGALQATGTATNMAIQGDGFFMVKQSGQQLYTRAGDFSLDQTGNVVTPDGGIVQGWVATSTGVVNTNATPTNLTLPLGVTMPAVQTSTATLQGNLNSATAAAASVNPASITMYDAKGNATPITFSFTANGPDATTGDDDWTITASDSAGNVLGTADAQFDGTGKLTAATTNPAPFTINGQTVNVSLTGVSEYGGATTIGVSAQNGSAPGSLTSFSIGQDGTVTGVFSNNLKQSLGVVALATFTNPPGLQKEGDSLYEATVSSGNPQVGTANSGGRGTIASGDVEMSNVDLGQEFTQLIVAQRGFEANSKVITSSDELLQDLVNMIH